MNWHYYDEDCHPGVCGDMRATCVNCHIEVHCDFFPKHWTRSCIIINGVDGQRSRYHSVFCCRKCENIYLQAVMPAILREEQHNLSGVHF